MNKKLIAHTLLLLGAISATAQTESLVNYKEVVVTGTRNETDVRQLPLTVTQISGELWTSCNLSMIPTIMEETPGLFSTSRGIIGYGVSTNAAGGIKVRGVGSGAELLVLIDGQPQYAGLMGHPIPDAYQTLIADKVEILRGPASMLYGSNAMGGVINIVTKELGLALMKNSGLISVGSYGTLQAEFAHTKQFGKFTHTIAANYQKTDGHRENSDFKQYNLFYKAGYVINQHLKLNGDVDFTQFKFSNPGPVSAPLFDADANISRGLASVSLTNKYEKTSGSLRAYYDWGYHKINDGHLENAPEKEYLYKHNDYIAGINYYQSASLFANNRTTIGFDWQNFGGEAWNDSIENGNNAPYAKIENQNEIAGYIDFRQGITSWLTADFGTRVDHHSQTGTEIVPQGGISFSLKKNQDVKALISKGFRNPTISEMYMFAANPDLKPEEMMNYEISYKKSFKKLGCGVNLYYIKGDNLIERTKNPNGAGYKQQNIGEFENCGFELEAKYLLSNKWTMKANYSYLNMGKPVTGAPENKLDFSVIYNTKKFYSKVNIENINGLYITTGENPEKENYTLLNANFGYKFLHGFTAFVKGENLLAQRYETYAGFPMSKATFMFGIRYNVVTCMDMCGNEGNE